MKIVIAAAGTGGHVYPALMIAEAMVAEGVERSDIVVFGGNRRAETAAPEAGFGFTGFELAKLRRSLAPSNLAIPLVVRRTISAMTDELERTGARVVLGMSGYVTVPAVLAARRAGVPFLLHEQNASPGLAARFASRRAVATFLGLPGRAERLAHSEIVGNPLRPQLRDFDRARLRAEALARYDLARDATVIGIAGGSLGARVLNEAAGRIVETVGDSAMVVHLTGEARAGASGTRAHGERWRQLAYEDRMDLFFAACDLVICRAGAMTVSEVAATRTPAVFVPLESVGQQHNAAALVERRAALMVRQRDIEHLPSTIASLLSEPQRLASLAAASGPIGLADAATAVARRVIEAGS